MSLAMSPHMNYRGLHPGAGEQSQFSHEQDLGFHERVRRFVPLVRLSRSEEGDLREENVEHRSTAA